MTESALLTQEIGPILQLTLNRPAKHNALNEAIFRGLAQGLETFIARPDLRVMLIRAQGKYFSAGADLAQQPLPEMHGSSSAMRTWYRRELNGMLALYHELEATEKPIVVAHHATCIGGGLELSLSCDFRLAASSARYAFPEGNFGSLPASGGVSRLTRLVGPHWARWLIMANRPIDAADALSIGLVHEVYPDDEFDTRVMQFCEHLCRQPPEFMAMCKVAIELAADLESAQARNLERLANSVLTLGKEHEELLAAWKARFSGSGGKTQ
jgi:enoyl-CoA hydratase/carnithine racemase